MNGPPSTPRPPTPPAPLSVHSSTPHRRRCSFVEREEGRGENNVIASLLPSFLTLRRSQAECATTLGCIFFNFDVIALSCALGSVRTTYLLLRFLFSSCLSSRQRLPICLLGASVTFIHARRPTSFVCVSLSRALSPSPPARVYVAVAITYLRIYFALPSNSQHPRCPPPPPVTAHQGWNKGRRSWCDDAVKPMVSDWQRCPLPLPIRTRLSGARSSLPSPFPRKC